MFHIIDLIWLAIRLLVVAGIPSVIVTRLAIAVVRFVRLPSSAKRHYPAALWGRFRHRWLMTQLGLAYLDTHRRKVRPIPVGTAVKVERGVGPRMRLRFPPASYRADPYGLVVRLKTIPKVSAADIEQNAVYLADAYKAVRVSVTQPKPARVEVRAFRRDPLTEPLAASVLPVFDGRHVTLGRDELGAMRRISIAQHSGSVWAGSPGRGKTECALSLATQLAPSPLVDMWVLDGGANDWQNFEDGARGYVADDLEAARDMLRQLDRLMCERRRNLQAELGVRNVWSAGLSVNYRLQWVLLEEAPFYFSLEAVKGSKTKTDLVTEIRGLVAGLLRRGRAPGFHVSMIGQKITSSSIPPDLRDLAGVRWSFGCSTNDSAVAALGADIRDYDSLSPVQLQDDEHVGVASTLLPTGGNPFTLIKWPAIGEALADKTALELAGRQAVTVPDDVSELTEGEPAR
jgi:S-DNA-T family DNA segregation ATPase FtsK/SpoIIIE